jgi:HPt (histidine-containing phosphotransfer) domain-containing protein
MDGGGGPRGGRSDLATTRASLGALKHMLEALLSDAHALKGNCDALTAVAGRWEAFVTGGSR